MEGTAVQPRLAGKEQQQQAGVPWIKTMIYGVSHSIRILSFKWADGEECPLGGHEGRLFGNLCCLLHFHPGRKEVREARQVLQFILGLPSDFRGRKFAGSTEVNVWPLDHLFEQRS